MHSASASHNGKAPPVFGNQIVACIIDSGHMGNQY